jgi:hypothetical protein
MIRIGRPGTATGSSIYRSLPNCWGAKPVRSELTYLLVSPDKEYTGQSQDVAWEQYYARRVIDHFASQKQ